MKNDSNYTVFHDALSNIRRNNKIEELVDEVMEIGRHAMIGKLISGILHEIVNPINGIINYAQILKDLDSGSYGETDIPDRIIKEGNRIADTVRDLRSFARGNTGEKIPTHPKSLLLDLIKLADPLIQKENIKIRINAPDSLPWMEVEINKVQLVILNILFHVVDVLRKSSHVSEEDRTLHIDACIQESGEKQIIVITFLYKGNHPPLGILDRLYSASALSAIKTGQGQSILPACESIMNELNGSIRFEINNGDLIKVFVSFPLNNDRAGKD